MTLRCGFLVAYRLLLEFYPPAFKRRFGAEMLELAEACEPNEWPLMFGDTSVAMVRCWIEGTHSTPVFTEPNAYVPVGESPVSAFQLLQGLVLSIAILAGIVYVNHRWPPPCPNSFFPDSPISDSHPHR